VYVRRTVFVCEANSTSIKIKVLAEKDKQDREKLMQGEKEHKTSHSYGKGQTIYFAILGNFVFEFVPFF